MSSKGKHFAFEYKHTSHFLQREKSDTSNPLTSFCFAIIRIMLQAHMVMVEEVRDEEATGKNDISDESYVCKHWTNMDKDRQAVLAKELGFPLHPQ
jgi:hypothetical protein